VYYVKVSANEIIALFSISLRPVKLLWSAVSLWNTNFILHSWQIHIAFRSSGCIYNLIHRRCIYYPSDLLFNISSSLSLFKKSIEFKKHYAAFIWYIQERGYVILRWVLHFAILFYFLKFLRYAKKIASLDDSHSLSFHEMSFTKEGFLGEWPKDIRHRPKRENDLNDERSLRHWRKASNKPNVKVIKRLMTIVAIIIIP
jgi:hypothetical protein